MENYNILGNNGYRRVFKIPVGKLTKEEAEKHIKEFMDKYKEEVIVDDITGWCKGSDGSYTLIPEAKKPWYKRIFR